VFETSVEAGVLQLRRPATRWLSTGFDGGFEQADAAYNVTVPDGWKRTDLEAYVSERLAETGFARDGPALLTGVAMDHARGAQSGSVVAYATVGLSNPATLPFDPDEATDPRTEASDAGDSRLATNNARKPPVGTVNLVVGTTAALPDGALGNLVAVATEAKTATLQALAGVTGTTSDAVLVAADPAGERAQFTGSATPVGAATRACVREAVTASFRSRYDEDSPPSSVAEADHGVVTNRRATVFDPDSNHDRQHH
jgi:adenosylcobinamide hydrolase